MKGKTFTLNNEHVKQKIGIEFTFVLKIKIQVQHFSGEYHRFFSY